MRIVRFAPAAVAVVFAACTSGGMATKVDLEDVDQKVAYAIGLDIGRKMQQQGLEIDPAIVARGLADGFGGGEALLDEPGMRQAMMEFQQRMMAKEQARESEEGAAQAAAGKAFLAENGAKSGVKTTESGLQIEVLTEGKGAKPTPSDTVTVHYTGTLIDGTEFDSSVKRGEPATFPLNGVIPGWTEGLQLMNVGSKARLVIPSELGYGPRGAGGRIPPNAVLVFEVELLDIKK